MNWIARTGLPLRRRGPGTTTPLRAVLAALAVLVAGVAATFTVATPASAATTTIRRSSPIPAG
ncbi:hypothetical protein [Micromonospora sp. WMMD708]|uniref:hypothetical protein n=1 Tax=Micromonospora sp. WMMD708 TaxID=3403464 RepID=UPI003BF4C70B